MGRCVKMRPMVKRPKDEANEAETRERVDGADPWLALYTADNVRVRSWGGAGVLLRRHVAAIADREDMLTRGT